MNFLAHLYLSDCANNPRITVGNFMADFVKGKQYEQYDEFIVKGIKIHREIDSFTDSHPVVTKAKAQLHNEYGKFSGIIIDMFYDHFLALHWKEYSEIDLETFAATCYSIIRQHQEIVPPDVLKMLYYMERNNWLVSYSTIAGIEKAMKGLSRRVKFENKMHESTQALEKNFDFFEQGFRSFFPEIEEHIRKMLLSA